jgi:hypothetical protein
MTLSAKTIRIANVASPPPTTSRRSHRYYPRRRASRVVAAKPTEDDDDAVEKQSNLRRLADDDDKGGIDFTVDVEAEFKRGLEYGRTEIRGRFTPDAVSTVDRGLPIADAMVATSAQVFVAACALAAGSRPSWLIPSTLGGLVPNWRGLPYLVPAIGHGTKLATVWLVGALAGKAYQRRAFDGSFKEAMKRTTQAGCFAVGLLIVVTQFEVAHKFDVAGLGEPLLGGSREGDLILNGALSELLVDIASEAAALLAWRAIRWNTSPTDPATLLEEKEEEWR